MKIISLFAAVALCSVAVAQARPRCLIAQPIEENGQPRFDVANPLAESLDAVGQVESVTYGMDDPIYRFAFLDGKAPRPVLQPKEKDCLLAAKAIGAVYLIWVDSKEEKVSTTRGVNIGLRSKLTLYKNGKKIWEDDQTQLVLTQTKGMDDTRKGLGASFANKLAIEPWKDLKKNPKSAPADIGKGQAPIVLDSKDDDPILNDFNAVQDQVKTLIAAGRLGAAELLLRDAIDAAPREPARRLALINFLREFSMTTEAVNVTIAAAAALGDPTLTSTAARILLDAGRKPEAATIVNDVLATNPTHEPIRILAAELRMREANPSQALKHLEVALKTPSAEAYYMRAICRGLLGAEDGVRLDIQRAVKEESTITSTLFVRMSNVLDEALAVEGTDLRALFQKAVLNRKSTEVSEAIDAQERLGKALIVLVGENSPTTKYDKSHATRVLAFNLLIQTMSELKQYISTGEEEALTEARIDLGELLRTLTMAKEQFAQECKDASTSKSDSNI